MSTSNIESGRVISMLDGYAKGSMDERREFGPKQLVENERTVVLQFLQSLDKGRLEDYHGNPYNEENEVAVVALARRFPAPYMRGSPLWSTPLYFVASQQIAQDVLRKRNIIKNDDPFGQMILLRSKTIGVNKNVRCDFDALGAVHKLHFSSLGFESDRDSMYLDTRTSKWRLSDMGSDDEISPSFSVVFLNTQLSKLQSGMGALNVYT